MALFPADRSYVQAVLDAVARAGKAPADMRYFAARESSPADYCRERVRGCGIYVAVVGFRYGSLVPGEAISYTELEFEAAATAGLPRLVFLLEEPSTLPARLADAERGAVEEFRRRLRGAGLIVRTFTSHDSLELEVFHALAELGGSRPAAVPRQLPPALAGFAGRASELAALDRIWSGAADGPVIVAIVGMAGAGKTALALRWAHQAAAAGHFPDGQLYVNLRGFDPGGQVTDPAEAVRGFLEALGVAAEQIPAGPVEQAALYRSELAGRRMLIVLDNARDAGQVSPLLAGEPGCLVLVTSRHQLSALVSAYGARPVTLGPLTAAEARELLARRLGASRVSAEPMPVQEIITHCARLPLALALVAARGALHPDFPLHVLAAELRDPADRLDPLSSLDHRADIRTVFSWSYRALSPPAARMFRLLGLHPGPDIAVPAAASLAAVPLRRARALLSELADAHLITEHAPSRYACHDLLGDYAAALARNTAQAARRRDAILRTLDHYLHTARAAAQLLFPHHDLPAPPPRSAGATPQHLSDQDQAQAWFTAEEPVLAAAVSAAADNAFPAHAWQLAWAAAEYLYWRGHWHRLAAITSRALTAAQQSADPQGQATMHRILASACARLNRPGDARAHHGSALEQYHLAGDLAGQAHTHQDMAMAAEILGNFQEVLRHAEHAQVLYQAAGHPRGQARALNNIGWAHAQLGNYADAITHCRQALALHQAARDQQGQAVTWDSLGQAYSQLGHHQQAIACHQRALDLHPHLANRYHHAAILTHLGDAHLAAGSPSAARAAWQDAHTILHDIGHPEAEQILARITAHDTTTSPGTTTAIA
jgi:tetratricopeptide (TPR) repeat protein